MIDHELLMLYARQRREELLRAVELSRGIRPEDVARAPRRPVPAGERRMRPARRAG